MTKLKNKTPEDYFAKVVSELKGFAIFMMNTEGIIIFWNLGCEMINGYKPEEAIGNHFEILFHDFLRSANFPQQELEHAYINGRYESENWRRQKNGNLFWAQPRKY